jgi:hypothetical protein
MNQASSTRLAVDPDRDLGDAGVDHHLAPIRLVSPKSSARAQQAGCLVPVGELFT